MVPTISRAKNMSWQIVFVFWKNHYIKPRTTFEICPESISRMMVNFVLSVCPIVLRFGVHSTLSVCYLSAQSKAVGPEISRVKGRQPYT